MIELSAAGRRELADIETPISAYVKLCAGEPYSYLLESAEGLENVGRFSIVAWDPIGTLELSGGEARLCLDGQTETRPQADFFDLARRAQAEVSGEDGPGLPFVGAWSGYVGYDLVRLIERLPEPGPAWRPQARLSLPSRFVVFDHLSRAMHLCALAAGEAEARAKVAEIRERLTRSRLILPAGGRFEVEAPPQDGFMSAVARAKEYIRAGDIFQVVLSERFRGRGDVHPLSVYRHLRVKSPSPYMFYLDFGDSRLVGASPETLVKVEAGRVHLRPIAGTRPRSADAARDRELEQELISSPKERAEHLMLVDLARNDAGRVSAYGSVSVDPYMTVERFSHVMHLVSSVRGDLTPGADGWDVFRACFPAGTVSGAPKVRAMEIIDELERWPRGVYAGGVGRFGPGPSLDTCIAIRMMQFQGDEFIQQVGAGIVADSEPALEYEEISHKGAQGVAALRAAAEDRS